MSKLSLVLLILCWVAVGMMWPHPELFSAATRYGFTITTGIVTIRAFYRAYKRKDRKHGKPF